VLHVRQRADRYNTIGAPKSKAGSRTVPLAPELVTALKAWKIACPISAADLVFPTGTGERLRETGESKPLMTYRKRIDDVETGKKSLPRDSGAGLIAARTASGMKAA
jgi:integrase